MTVGAEYVEMAVALEELPERFARVRKRRGLTYRQAAAEMGGLPNAGNLCQFEHRERGASLVTAARILRWLAEHDA